jgi:stress-induced morphogen
MSVMTAAEIRSTLAGGLSESQVMVRDTTGGGDHFEATIISPAFRGKSMVEQHRLVYSVLGAAVGREIHALALRTFTPEQWGKVSGGSSK